MAVQLADSRSTAEGWLAEAVGLLIDAGDAGRGANTPSRSGR